MTNRPAATKGWLGQNAYIDAAGYELSEFRTDAQQALLVFCDMVVTERYRAEECSLSMPWRGTLTVTGFPPPALVE